MDEATNKAKELIGNFEKRTRRFREMTDKEKKKIGGDEKDETVDLLSKMVGVFKAHVTGEDGEEDLVEMLRLVEEEAETQKGGALPIFAKIFVHMHTNLLAMRGSGSGSSIPSTASSQSNQPSSSSSSSGMVTVQRQRTTITEEILLKETPNKKKRESTVSVSDEEKENETVKKDTVEANDERGRKKKRRSMLNLDIDMKDVRVNENAARTSMGEGRRRGRETLDTVPEDTTSRSKDVSSTPKRKSTLDSWVKREAPSAASAADAVRATISTTSLLREKIGEGQMDTVFSPRSRKARAAVRKNPMVPVPSHHGRGGAESWECGGLACKRKFTNNSDLYIHMLNEHYLDGPIVAKCLDCAKIGGFPELIVHRKTGDEATCGGDHATLAYWCVVEEEKREEEMNEEEKKQTIDKIHDQELAKTCRLCIHIGCKDQGTEFASFELLDNHNLEVHGCRFLYGCSNSQCGRILPNPMTFIRHRGHACHGVMPYIYRKMLNWVEIEETKKMEIEQAEMIEEDEKMEDGKNESAKKEFETIQIDD